MKEINKLGDTEVNKYKDILNTKYPFPLLKERQKITTRAGMFAPFAALTGYDEQVKETERITDYEIILDEDNKTILDKKLNLIRKNLNKIEVKVIYFIKDKKKSGGKYITKTGIIKRIDNYTKELIFNDKTKINIKNIIRIEINK